MLRDAPHLVHAVFGKHWAGAWCGFTPAPSITPAPDSLASRPHNALPHPRHPYTASLLSAVPSRTRRRNGSADRWC